MTPMPLQPYDERTQGWNEVLRGFDEDAVRAEADRCLQCGHPLCVQGCPNHNPIPSFIGLVQEGRYAEAAAVDYLQNSLPACTGRVCSWETQCEGHCVLTARGEGVRIGAIERFIADYALSHPEAVAAASERVRQSVASHAAFPSSFPYTQSVTAYRAVRAEDQPDWMGTVDRPLSDRSVAVVGAGPAGLTCADFLRRRGVNVMVYEAQQQAGGLLSDGIPEFVLPAGVVDAELGRLRSAGVEFRFGVALGRDVDLDDLREAHDAVFVGIGAGLARTLGIPGEDAKGVWSAQAFLHQAKLARTDATVRPPEVGQHVLVVGAGNTAMDAARTALRLGARDVRIVYRRTRAESPSRSVEISHAMEEGVSFDYLVLPISLQKDESGRLTAANLQRMELGAPDSSGRRRPVPVQGSAFAFPCDTLIQAVGYSVAGDQLGHPEALAKGGWIEAETQAGGGTAIPGVFAGGDGVRGPATVVEAVYDGRRAAQAIATYLAERSSPVAAVAHPVFAG